MFRKYDKPTHLNLDSVKFSMFTSEDVRKLSVAKIITANVLDNLGHPLPGGLYDPVMGKLCNKNRNYVVKMLYCFRANVGECRSMWYMFSKYFYMSRPLWTHRTSTTHSKSTFS